MHAAAQLDLANRRVLQAGTVGIGAGAGAVVRLAVTGGQVQQLNKRLLVDQGQAQFSEVVLYAIGAVHTDRRAALSGQVAGCERRVGA